MAEKQHMSVVICGHVDSGKSTTTGRLLFELGGIPEREMEKLKEKVNAPLVCPIERPAAQDARQSDSRRARVSFAQRPHCPSATAWWQRRRGTGSPPYNMLITALLLAASPAVEPHASPLSRRPTAGLCSLAFVPPTP